MPDSGATTTRGRGRAGTLLAPVAAAALVVGGVVWYLQQPPQVEREPAGVTASPQVGTTAQAVPAPRRPGSPQRLRIPALGVDAPVVPVRAPDRTLVPPADPQRLGWWAAGAKPGDTRGSALVAGHTVHAGGGALDDLEEVEPGDRVSVRTDRGAVRYVVQRVRIFDKGALARHATRLFSQEVPGRLVVITCEDWDGSRYLSNVVVTAVPA